MQNSTSAPYAASVFSPPPYAVAVNALFFASLGVVLIAAFLCMLVKGWIRELDRKLRGIPDLQKRAVIKELREQGLLRWRLPEIITILPSMIHLSLVLFFIGLALYLLQVHKLPAFLAISIFGLGVLLYILSIFVSAIDDFSPFRSVYSRALGVLYRRLYSRLLSPLAHRDLSFMALPQTIAETIREQISTFIKTHEPLPEQAILDAQLPSSKQLISQASAPVLSKLWRSVDRGDTSAYAKNISTSILLQLDNLDIRPPRNWHLPWFFETSNPSTEEAKCLLYNICMQGHLFVSLRTWETICASVRPLEQRPDPWFNLVTLLIQTKYDGDWDILRLRESPDGVRYVGAGPNAALREAELLQAISDIILFSEGQWLFVLSTIFTHFVRQKSTNTRALVHILVTLLEKHVMLGGRRSPMRAGEHIDFWIHVMMTLLGARGRFVVGKSTTILDEEVKHARDLEAYGGGNIRNPNYIRQLLQLSEDHGLDPSLLRGCLVTILCILISNDPMNQQEIRLVNQYLDIIGEEMDVIAWSTPLSELPPRSESVVSCLLRGTFLPAQDRWRPPNNGQAAWILREFDLKLTAAGAQPTTSILRVIDWVWPNSSFVAGLRFRMLGFHSITIITPIPPTPLPLRLSGLLVAHLLHQNDSTSMIVV